MKSISLPVAARRSHRLSPAATDLLRGAVVFCLVLLATLLGCLVIILTGGIPMP